MTEQENCDYHDYEFDHTPEEVASDLPPGHGSNTYSDKEFDEAVTAHDLISVDEFEKMTRPAGVTGAGPTDCMNCGEVDGRTRVGGLHCHDCMEAFPNE